MNKSILVLLKCNTALIFNKPSKWKLAEYAERMGMHSIKLEVPLLPLLYVVTSRNHPLQTTHQLNILRKEQRKVAAFAKVQPVMPSPKHPKIHGLNLF